MKKIFLSVLAFVLMSVFAYASDVSDLLDKAKDEYAKGNLNEAVKLIDSAKKLLDKEQISANGSDYIEVSNWNIVKVKKSEYIGKKIKIKAKFLGIHSDGDIWLSGVSAGSYEDTLADKVLELKKYTSYTFYGTVKENSWTGYPWLYIEAIE